ncbi:hypothetical protein QFZ47_004598 [Variovorax paradoxus]|nr:hypothetical protein [Variovorax paradoxus]
MKCRIFFLGAVRAHTLYPNRIGVSKVPIAGKQMAN